MSMIKDNVYPDYEEHHIEILSELDSNDVVEPPEDSKWDCLIISIVGALILATALLFTIL